MNRTKVLVIAFHHYDNVLLYTNAIAKYTNLDISVVMLCHGNRFFTGAIDADISSYKLGMHAKLQNGFFPKPILDYLRPVAMYRLLKLAPMKVTVKNMLVNYGFLTLFAAKIWGKYDVYHFNGAGPYSLYLSLLLKPFRRVLTIHDHIAHSGEDTPMTSFTNWLLIKNIKYHIQHYDYLRESVIKHFKLKPERVWTVRSGTFDLFERLEPKKHSFENYVLFFGRISPYKGLPYLVKAYLEYAKQSCKLNLVIAGAGRIEGIETIIREEPRIALINRELFPAELVGLVKCCKAVVCPYMDATHSAVVMVAYAFNKPVLVHNVGGLKEVVVDKKSGILMENLEVQTIVNALMALEYEPFSSHECENYISELKENGFISWKNIAHDYQKVYSKVAKQ